MYFQIYASSPEHAIPKNAIIISFVLFEFLRLPVDLRNAGSIPSSRWWTGFCPDSSSSSSTWTTLFWPASPWSSFREMWKRFSASSGQLGCGHLWEISEWNVKSKWPINVNIFLGFCHELWQILGFIFVCVMYCIFLSAFTYSTWYCYKKSC